MLTGSFNSDTGLLRIRWDTRPLDPALAVSFRVTLHSAVSGRQIAVMADTQSAGQGSGSLAEGLNVSYFTVESTNLHWEINVDEGTVGVEKSGQ